MTQQIPVELGVAHLKCGFLDWAQHLNFGSSRKKLQGSQSTLFCRPQHKGQKVFYQAEAQDGGRQGRKGQSGTHAGMPTPSSQPRPPMKANGDKAEGHCG